MSDLAAHSGILRDTSIVAPQNARATGGLTSIDIPTGD